MVGAEFGITSPSHVREGNWVRMYLAEQPYVSQWMLLP
jgi:hypothetical protein